MSDSLPETEATPQHVRRPKSIPLPPSEKPDLKSMSFDELSGFVESMGEKSFRAKQIFHWIHHHGVRDFEEMTTLSESLRKRLMNESVLSGLHLKEVLQSRDGTRKLLMETIDGHRIETVLIPSDGRMTQCISSQVGCRIGCTFCLTATMPIRRDLLPGEILDQVYHARQVLAESGENLNNLVYMGMGEPLDNFDAVVRSCDLLMDERGQGFSPRRITVSTSGLAPQIGQLATRLRVNVALSLNASDDATRDKVIPINRKYNMESLQKALQSIPREHRRKVTVEYVLLRETNDTDEDARRLVRFVKPLYVRVNLIPFNPYPGALFGRPEDRRVNAFGRILRDAGITVTVRQSRGEDIGAACGMLDGA